MYEHNLTKLFADIASCACRIFGVKTEHIHEDTTSFAVSGQYLNKPEKTADPKTNIIAITHGYLCVFQLKLRNVGIILLLLENALNLNKKRAKNAHLWIKIKLCSSYLAPQCVALVGRVFRMPAKEEGQDSKKRLNLCGVHLRRIRQEKHLTLVDLQATLELDYGIALDRTNLGRIENGERTVTDIELAVLAHLLEVTLEHLLWGETPPDVSQIGETLEKVQVRYATRRPLYQRDP